MVDEMRVILDTPSKKTLWAYILPRMPLAHRDYVLRIVDLPKQQILGKGFKRTTKNITFKILARDVNVI